MHSLADIYNNQYKENSKKEDVKQLVLHMPEMQSLLKHLNLLYSVILTKQMQEEEDRNKIQWYNTR